MNPQDVLLNRQKQLRASIIQKTSSIKNNKNSSSSNKTVPPLQLSSSPSPSSPSFQQHQNQTVLLRGLCGSEVPDPFHYQTSSPQRDHNSVKKPTTDLQNTQTPIENFVISTNTVKSNNNRKSSSTPTTASNNIMLLPKFHASNLQSKSVSRAEQLRRLHKSNANSIFHHGNSNSHKLLQNSSGNNNAGDGGGDAMFVSPLKMAARTPSPSSTMKNEKQILPVSSSSPSQSQQQDDLMLPALQHQHHQTSSSPSPSPSLLLTSTTTTPPPSKFRYAKGSKVTASSTSSQHTWSSLLEPRPHHNAVQNIIEGQHNKRLNMLRKAYDELTLIQQEKKNQQHHPHPHQNLNYQQQMMMMVSPTHSQQQIQQQQ